MKLIILLLSIFFIPVYAIANGIILTGTVSDATTKQALAGATLSITELNIAVTTNTKGEFSFTSIPAKGRFLVEVRFVGYRTITQIIDLAASNQLRFELQPSIIEIHEVVVTGTFSGSDIGTNSTTVSAMNKTELLSRPSNNIIDAISGLPGVSQVTTGAAVSKPVIRGLSYNRVITLLDGVKQEGQQWGDEHGIEIDQYSADRVEVLKGAASLQYGSDALGGVINILNPLSPANGIIKGEFLSNYASNNGLSGTSAMLQGNTNGFVWQGRATYKNAFGFNTPETRIPNTSFNETNFNGLIGITKNWGYTHVNVSSFKTKLGLPDFERNDDGKFIDEYAEELPISLLKSRKLLLPYQDVSHYKVALNSQFLFNKSRLRTTLAFQNNQRKELEESVNIPSLFFNLKTYSYNLKYYFLQINGWEPVIGISGAFQNSVNKAEELLIPNYESKDAGGFAYLKKTWNKTTVNAGLRFDWRNTSGIQMEDEGKIKFINFSASFSNFSGAVGLTHRITDHLNFKANAGSAFRAPNIAELSSDGIHEGTFRYEIGNPSLKAEQSFNTDAALEYHSDKIDSHFNVFNNFISNYIYTRQQHNEQIEAQDSEYPVYRYVQDNANLYGLEAGLTIHPIALIHLENDFSVTRGRNLLTKQWLPLMPAPVLKNQLRFEPKFKSKAFINAWLSAGIETYFSQNQFDQAFETKTSSYTLVNASVGITVRVNQQPIRLYITSTNLLNKAYVNHLSRLKYEGILNQGRNVVFGLFIPLEFSK